MAREKSPKHSPNKRLKALASTIDSEPQQSAPSSITKGKSKIEKNEIEPTDCCGICLSEFGADCNGIVGRGCIDSCSHYFCFVCIMEWAKVESRCPLCKRRFSTIRRPPKPPIFPYERVFHVPVRDQVYDGLGNTSTGLPDPYSDVKCSTCNSSEDESLLLLCDLCDSAAHTYCAGLAANVPEGDWFCKDCTLMRDEQAKNEMETDPQNQFSSGTVLKIQSQDIHTSVIDIVREPCSTVVERNRNVSSDPRTSTPPSSVADDISTSGYMHSSSSRMQQNLALHTTKSNARTLRHCRNVHDRICILRKSWNKLRSGALTFSSGQGDGSISGRTPLSCKRSNQPYSLACQNHQSSGESGASGILVNNNRTHEIHKAWKMMEIAKTIGRGHENSDIVRKDSKYPIKKLSPLKRADNMSSRRLPPKSQQNGYNEPASSKVIQISPRLLGPEKLLGKRSLSGSAHPSVSVMSETFPCVKEVISTGSMHLPPKGQQSGYSGSASSKIIPKSARVLEPEKQLRMGSSSGSAHSISSVVSEPLASNVCHIKEVNYISSGRNTRCSKEKTEVGNSCVDIKAGKVYDTKGEIQSLVKLNLKLQTKEKKLEVDAYKEVARLATHSILAACRLEQPKPGLCAFSGSVCSHPIEVQQGQRSTLMPNSCRKCFYIFVKDVVHTIMLQKKETTGSS